MIRLMSSRIRLLFVTGVFICLHSSLMSAQAAEEQARRQAKAKTLAALHLDATYFLGIQRREVLEQLFASAAGEAPGRIFFYELSNNGDEVRGSTVIHHAGTDNYLNYFVGISSGDGTAFRIGGFVDSLLEFNRLMSESHVRISYPERARSIVDFYLAVSPERIVLNPLKSPLEYKQTAERQCHARGGDFAALDKEFANWWASQGVTYLNTDFEDKITPSGGGFKIHFFTLSTPSRPGKCGAVPVAATIEISDSGVIKPVTFEKVAGGSGKRAP